MRRKSIKDLQAAVRQAEAELEAATKRSDVNATARRLLRAHLDHPEHQPAARFYDLMAARALGADAEFEPLAQAFVDRFGETAWAE